MNVALQKTKLGIKKTSKTSEAVRTGSESALKRRHGLLRSFLVFLVRATPDGGGCGGRLRLGVLGFSSRRGCRRLKPGLRLRGSLGCLLQQLLRDLLASFLVHRSRFRCFRGGGG